MWKRGEFILRTTLITTLVVAAVVAAGIGAAYFGDQDGGTPAGTFAGTPAGARTQSTDRDATVEYPFGSNTFRAIASAQMPMVVNIRTESRRQTQELDRFFGPGSPFERFFGFGPQTPSPPREQILQGAGSGFIIDKSGLILTNNHVVEGATAIAVALYADEGEEYDAKVIGRDALSDSALIQLTEMPDHPLPAAMLGSSAQTQPGDWVMAIGNPFNLAHTVTVGVISAVGRSFPISEGRFQAVLQTDAAINPGNSGGPLLNLAGEVVGINSAIVSGGGQGNVGVGFAIPIDTVRELLPELRRGTVTRGRIGVQVTPVTRQLASALGLGKVRGALVRMVDDGGPADAAGIEPGDAIVKYNGMDVSDSRQLVDLVSHTRPGTTVPVEIVRDGRPQTVRVAIARLELPDGNSSSATVEPNAGFGLSLRDLSPDVSRQLRLPQDRPGGALVAMVDAGSAAARAGIQAGDVILEINRKAVANAAAAATAMRAASADDVAFVLVWRDNRELFLTVSK